MIAGASALSAQRPSAATTGSARVPLAAADFTQVSKTGFGDGQNSYAHAMAWFRDRVYVGTSRHALALLAVFPPARPPAMDPWPVPVPTHVEDLDLHGEIWQLDPGSMSWSLAHRSPDIPSLTDGVVPRELGYRGMAIFQGASDASPALYVTSVSSVARGGGARILRSVDGEHFEPVGRPGLGNDRIASFRSLVEHGGWLYAAPTGEGERWNTVTSPVVLRSRDPSMGVWEQASPPAFGDATNSGIFEFAVFDGHLYAGTFNHISGFQIWKTPGTGEDGCVWRKVLDGGAARGPLNEIALSMCVFRGALYVGSGIQNGGFDRMNDIGPAAAELIRIHPDDSWDLIVGEARRTTHGTKLPLAGCGPGFDNIFAGYVWRLHEHDGVLYATTFDWSVFLPYAQQAPRGVRRMMHRIGIERMVAERGGFDLLASTDGTTWKPLLHDGLGNPYNHGGRNLLSTPHGLFVGTANPFGPEVAARLACGWTYAPNPGGGTEVWLGRPGRAVAESPSSRRMQRVSIALTTSAVSRGARVRRSRHDATCLVTGATGQIGSALLPVLLEHGERVRVLALADTVDDLAERDVDVVVGGMSDLGPLREAVDGVSTVYHLAGALPGASHAQLAEVNVRGTDNLLCVCRGAGSVRRLVFTSSVAVYEGAFVRDDWPLNELSPVGPRGSPHLVAYGQSKIAGERLIHHHAGQAGFGFVVLRPATTYGLGNHDFVSTIERVLHQPAPREHPSPHFPAQLLHSSDLADAILRAGNHPAAQSETFNVAGADALDHGELAAIVRRVVGMEDDSIHGVKAADQWRLYVRPYDTRKAQRVIGFRPRVDIRDGIAEIVGALLSTDNAGDRLAWTSS